MTERELAPFQKVLVRDDEDKEWRANFFSHVHVFSERLRKYVCAGHMWEYCIPYEGNEHLLGTTARPASEFKFGDHVEVACGDDDWSKAVFIRKVDGPNPYECLLQCPWGDHATEVRGARCRHADW